MDRPLRRQALIAATGLAPLRFAYNLELLVKARIVESRRGALDLTSPGRRLLAALERVASRMGPTP